MVSNYCCNDFFSAQATCPTFGTLYAFWKGNNDVLDSSQFGNHLGNYFDIFCHFLEVPAGNTARYRSTSPNAKEGQYFDFTASASVLYKTGLTFPASFSFCAWLWSNNLAANRVTRIVRLLLFSWYIGKWRWK